MVFQLVPAVLGGVVGGGVVLVLARRHIDALRAVLAAAATCLALALGWYFTSWIAAAGVVAAILVYAVALCWIGGGRALLAACGCYLVVTIGAGAMLYAGLDAMG